MGTKHWIGMSGSVGCLPDNCDVYESASDAADSLGDLFGLSAKDIKRLRNDGYISLSAPDDGADYASIEPCTCDTPEIHSDSM